MLQDLSFLLPGALPFPRLPDLSLPDPLRLDLVEELQGDLDLSRLEDLAASLPPALSGPDATGEVATGASTIGREEAALGAALSAAPRILRALGPGAETVTVEGRVFAVADRYEDPESGFDAIRLRAQDGPEEVFAADGLEVGSEPDTLAALDLARPQARSAEFARFVADAQAAALGGAEVLFVGPSLGGALAQVAAHEAAQGVAAAGGTAAIRLVTVDALGGRDAAESLNGGALDPAALALIDALNLRTDGDIVSRIGSHIGPTVTFAPVDASGQPVQLSTAEAHVNVESLLATLRSETLFAAGVRGAPAEIGGFAALSNAAAGRGLDLAGRLGLASEPEGEIPLQVPGVARFDAAGTTWTLDADRDGAADILVGLSAPVANAQDLVFG